MVPISLVSQLLLLKRRVGEKTCSPTSYTRFFLRGTTLPPVLATVHFSLLTRQTAPRTQSISFSRENISADVAQGMSSIMNLILSNGFTLSQKDTGGSLILGICTLAGGKQTIMLAKFQGVRDYFCLFLLFQHVRITNQWLKISEPTGKEATVEERIWGKCPSVPHSPCRFPTCN